MNFVGARGLSGLFATSLVSPSKPGTTELGGLLQVAAEAKAHR
jgi:hypothetical protein